jgi:aryl-alcohol dehydrogenase-like predicted oxidoreductase
MKQLRISGIKISSLGLGSSLLAMAGKPSEAQAIATIHKALDCGITFINTSDAYCLDEQDKHAAEKLVRKALLQYSGDTQRVIVATKGGYTRPKGEWIANGDPDHLRRTIAESFAALGGDRPLDLWLLHCVDPNYSLKQSLAPVQQAMADGLIRQAGVSNCSLEQIKCARELVDLAVVENQLSLWHRKNEFNGVLQYCEQENITFVAWGALGGGGGKRRTRSLEQLPILFEIAQQRNISVYCILLTWLQSKSPNVVPLVGAISPSEIEDSAKCMNLQLSQAELSLIDQAMPPSLLDRGVFAWTKRQIKTLFPVA